MTLSVRHKKISVYVVVRKVIHWKAVVAINVNYANVNAFYFYFTPILDEIDVKDIFYLLPLNVKLCRRLGKFLYST